MDIRRSGAVVVDLRRSVMTGDTTMGAAVVEALRSEEDGVAATLSTVFLKKSLSQVSHPPLVLLLISPLFDDY